MLITRCSLRDHFVRLQNKFASLCRVDSLILCVRDENCIKHGFSKMMNTSTVNGCL